jgi:hypothetical protein
MTQPTSKFFLAGAMASATRDAGRGRSINFYARGVAMSEDYRIYVDGEQSATLNDGGGALTDYRTLQEAVLAWRGLRPEQKVRATVKVIGGPVYSAYEIDRLYYVPKPA